MAQCKKVGMGNRHDSKRTGRAGKTTTVAPLNDLSRITAPLGRWVFQPLQTLNLRETIIIL